MKTTMKTVTELIENNESPLPLAVIPNNMGISLSNVDALTWTRQNDGQIVSLTIHFVPAPNTYDGAASLVRSDALLERIRSLEDALTQVTDHFASVMDGPLVSGRGIKFANGVEGIPTIAKAREVLRSKGAYETR